MAVEIVTGHTGTAHVTADQQAEFNKGVHGSGNYLLPTRSRCACTVVTSNRISIGTGDILCSGRHIAIGTTEYVNISNGTQSQKRNDVIGVRYTKTSAGVESCRLEVIVGKPTGGTPADPTMPTSTITANTTNAFIPLYRIRITNLSVGTPERMIALHTAPDDDKTFLKKVYPVGAVYISFNNTNPATLFGGSWSQIQGRFLLSSTSSGSTGGETTHTLTEQEMPRHRHEGFAVEDLKDGITRQDVGYATPRKSKMIYTSYVGGGQAHNNMPPYITCYMWRRTA